MIEVLSTGPLVTVQDFGRPGFLSQGLAQGGVADRLALVEAAALIGQSGASLESPGAPLSLRVSGRMAVTLTGAPMRATVAGRALDWHATHILSDGDVLDLKPTGQGVYSYITPGGGLDLPDIMGSQAAHLIARIGAAIEPGAKLPTRAGGPDAPRRLSTPDRRFEGGTLRIVPTPQTALFSKDELARFEATPFTRDARGNRQGVRMVLDGPGFATEGQLNLLSDFILPGDIQMTGEGVPYILGPECQTTGGYPRIGTVIAADLPKALQAPVGAPLRFQFVSLEEARATRPPKPATQPLLRDPAEVPDLLSYQLIGGVVSARDT